MYESYRNDHYISDSFRVDCCVPTFVEFEPMSSSFDSDVDYSLEVIVIITLYTNDNINHALLNTLP